MNTHNRRHGYTGRPVYVTDDLLRDAGDVVGLLIALALLSVMYAMVADPRGFTEVLGRVAVAVADVAMGAGI